MPQGVGGIFTGDTQKKLSDPPNTNTDTRAQYLTLSFKNYINLFSVI